MVRDIFSAIYRDLGDLQTEELRQAIKESYTEKGFGVDAPEGLAEPSFARFFEILQGRQKPNVGLMARLHELGDYGFFKSTSDAASLLTTTKPVVVRIHATQNDLVQNALASFILLNIYQNMFIRGEQSRLTHAGIFDEAHRASRLRLLPTMAKECRKFGISLVVSSQAAKDFDSSLYSAVANYLILRVTEGDARVLAKIAADGSEAARLAGQMKTLDRYTAFFVTEGKRPRLIELGTKGDMHEP
jgi:hypothetical protein